MSTKVTDSDAQAQLVINCKVKDKLAQISKEKRFKAR
jgi:hypothetical protein